MNNVITFSPQTKCDNGVFLKEIWPKFYEMIHNTGVDSIILDMNNVVFISPLVLPKLCCLGVIARRNNKVLEMIFNPMSKMKEYLGQMNFYYINGKYNLLYIDDSLTGGEYGTHKINRAFLAFDREELYKKYNDLYSFDSSISESDKLKYCVRGEIFGSNNLLSMDRYNERIFEESPVLSVLKNFYSGDLKENYELIKEIGLNFAEIIHNSLWHGQTRCFLAMQVAKYRKEFIRVDVSFSDYGLGMYHSLSSKKWERNNKCTHFLPLERFLTLDSEIDKNYYSALEAALYRKSERVRGLYDVLQSLIGKRPRIDILNGNMLLEIDEEKTERLLNMDIRSITPCKMADIGFGFGMDISFSV